MLSSQHSYLSKTGYTVTISQSLVPSRRGKCVCSFGSMWWLTSDAKWGILIFEKQNLTTPLTGFAYIKLVSLIIGIKLS